MGMIKTVAVALAAMALLYLAIAFGLAILSPLPKNKGHGAGSLFSGLRRQAPDRLPALERYVARDGTRLGYRYYPAGASPRTVLVLIHGSAYQSAYLRPLAASLADAGVAVYTPDLRGHGIAPKRRGDVDYIGQLQDDLDDFLTLVHGQHPEARVILGGHSSGGGLVIRYAGGPHRDDVDGYLLLAPYISDNAPTHRADAGWARPDVPRLIGLTMLNRIGITALNHLPVIRFNMPADLRDGTETLRYSYRLLVSMNPGRDDYGRDIAALHAPTLVVVGRDDPVFEAEAFPPLFRSYNDHAEVALLNGLGHLDLVSSPITAETVKAWLKALPER